MKTEILTKPLKIGGKGPNSKNVHNYLWESSISVLDIDIQYFGGSLTIVFSTPAASNLHTVFSQFRGFSCDVMVQQQYSSSSTS